MSSKCLTLTPQGCVISRIFFRWNARFVQVFWFSVAMKQTALEAQQQVCSQFQDPGARRTEDSTGVCSDRPRPAGPAGLSGAVCLGLGSGCQRLQFFPQQAWGCKAPGTTFPHQACHLRWLSRHSRGQRASLSQAVHSRSFLGFLAARQT